MVQVMKITDTDSYFNAKKIQHVGVARRIVV
jgi:hypothetical protein